VYTSVLLTVVVLIGVDALGHLTDIGHIILLPAVPSLVKNNENANAPLGHPVKSKVNVQFPVRVAVTKFPLDNIRVAAVPVFPKA
jgi:hypothetical protein